MFAADKSLASYWAELLLPVQMKTEMNVTQTTVAKEEHSEKCSFEVQQISSG